MREDGVLRQVDRDGCELPDFQLANFQIARHLFITIYNRDQISSMMNRHVGIVNLGNKLKD